jgi:PAS domain-containing protein
MGRDPGEVLRPAIDDVVSIPFAEKATLWVRFKERWRGLFINEGVGPFVLGVLLLTLAAISFRAYWRSREVYRDRLGHEIQRSIGTTQEPSDVSGDFGFLGALLSDINQPETLARIRAQVAQPHDAGVRIRRLFAGLVGTSLAQSRTPLPKTALIEHCKQLLSFAHPSLVGFASEAAEAVESTANDLRQRHLPDIATCPLQSEYAIRAGFLGGPGCILRQKPALTSLLMPPQEFARYKHASETRLQDVIILSNLLELSVSLAHRLPSNYRSDPVTDVVQAYFISPDNVLRIWTTRDPDPVPEWPPTRQWASKRYFTYFWNHPDAPTYESMVYLDFGGHGLVSTQCDPLIQGHRFLGIICTDYHIANSALIESLGDTEFLSTLELRIPVDNASEQTISLREIPRLNDSKGAWRRFWVSTTAVEELSFGEVKRQIAEAVRANKIPALRNSVTKLWLPNERLAFLVPLASDDRDFRGLVVSARTPRWPLGANIALGLCIGSVVGVFAVALIGGFLSRKADGQSRRIALLRNLQVGVLRNDPDDWIIEANDRAEELLGRKLPKEPGPPETKFGDLFDELVVPSLPDLFTQPIRPGLTSSYASIQLARQHGAPSAYYARLRKQPRGWLFVQASPILFDSREWGRNVPERRDELRAGFSRKGTFGVIERPSAAAITYLEELVARTA